MQRSGDGAIERRKIGAVERQNLQPLLALRAVFSLQHWTKRCTTANTSLAQQEGFHILFE